MADREIKAVLDMMTHIHAALSMPDKRSRKFEADTIKYKNRTGHELNCRSRGVMPGATSTSRFPGVRHGRFFLAINDVNSARAMHGTSDNLEDCARCQKGMASSPAECGEGDLAVDPKVLPRIRFESGS